MEPEPLANFYQEVFDLIEKPRQAGDPNFYLSDGIVTMIIAPWKITDYAGTGIARPAMDHLGFTVESVDAFKADLEKLYSANDALTGVSLTATPENAHRLELLKRSKLGSFQMADPDGVLINVNDNP